MCTHQDIFPFFFLRLRETRRSLLLCFVRKRLKRLLACIGYFTSAECAIIAGVIFWQEEKVGTAEFSSQICDSRLVPNQKRNRRIGPGVLRFTLVSVWLRILLTFQHDRARWSRCPALAIYTSPLNGRPHYYSYYHSVTLLIHPYITIQRRNEKNKIYFIEYIIRRPICDRKTNFFNKTARCISQRNLIIALEHAENYYRSLQR